MGSAAWNGAERMLEINQLIYDLRRLDDVVDKIKKSEMQYAENKYNKNVYDDFAVIEEFVSEMIIEREMKAREE